LEVLRTHLKLDHKTAIEDEATKHT
jgi:hypothetical protein